MARIDFSNVNISLRQFEAISSGRYNAGEVKLTGQNSLGKINNHVHFTSLNNVRLSHAEVIAIKNAFVKALGDGGLDSASIDSVRARLGLAPSGAVDTSLKDRSIKPLSRQQIREILDKYAGALNVRTSDELKAGISPDELASRNAAREAVNGTLDGRRTAEANDTLVRFQKVLADDVDFFPAKEYNLLLQESKRQLEALYAGCNGSPSADRQAKARCTLAGGETVEIAVGMSESAYAEKLFLTIARLEYMDISRWQLADTREEYRNLDHEARVRWIGDLPNQPNALAKSRTAAVLALQEKGITDYEALSLVNRMSLPAVVDLLNNLEDPAKHENWDMSRDTVVGIMRQSPQHDDGASGCVYIPATSPSQYNKAIRTFFKDLSGYTPPAPPGYSQFARGVMDDLRSRFGEKFVPANDKLERYIDGNRLKHLVQVEGDGDYAQNVTPVRLDDLRAPFTEMTRTAGARRVVYLFAESVAKDIDVNVINPQLVANAITSRHPDLVGRLAACENPGQAEELLASIRADAESAVRRCAILDRYRLGDGFKNLVRRELSELTGIPVASLAGQALSNRRLTLLAGRLADKINTGKIQADTEEEIEAKFSEEAHRFAAERAAVLARVDGLGVTDETKAELKTWILAQEKVSFIDFDSILGKMSGVNDSAENLAQKLMSMRQKGTDATTYDRNAVYEAMKELSIAIDNLVEDEFKAKGVDADLPENMNLGTLVTILALGQRIGIRADIADFLGRPDVSDEMEANRENVDHPAIDAFRYQTYAAQNVAETNKAVMDGIASGRPDAMTGQAILQGCRDAGMEAVSPDDAIALFTAGEPLGDELRKAITGLPSVAMPQMVRTIVTALVRHNAGQVQ